MSLEFSDLKADDIFDGRALRLKEEGVSAKVSEDKAYLYSDSSESSRLKSYLVKGDDVKLLKFSAGFLKVTYINKDGKTLTRWISFSSLI
ncbi:hypothetical protein [Pseudomonas kitaguniensis]|uniref:hypothetical protein n=1 Tax=Pseudomonas kitaguniensis TaxID=2607908 RepID=UPI003CFF2219